MDEYMESMRAVNEKLENNIRIVKITRNYMIKNLDKFFAIESNWTDLGEKPWKKENFLLDLPLKWELSFAAEKGNSIIGYIIGSKYDSEISRVNKIMVVSRYRRCGIGKQLMEKYFAACLKKGMKKSELKALVENDAANRFYVRLGYQKIGKEKGTDNKIRNVYKKVLI